MISHSFNDEYFGKASQLHGATYIVDVSFSSPVLSKYNTVIDIGYASEVLKKVLEPLRYRNLDDMDDFKGILTTTEYMAAYIHHKVQEAILPAFQGKIKVTLGESHMAWASYESDEVRNK